MYTAAGGYCRVVESCKMYSTTAECCYECSIPNVVNSLTGVIQSIADVVNSKMEMFVVMYGCMESYNASLEIQNLLSIKPSAPTRLQLSRWTFQ